MCKAWHAAFAADPSLWPTAVVRGVGHLEAHEVENLKWSRAGSCATDDKTRASVLSEAADVSRRAQAVRLDRFGLQVGCGSLWGLRSGRFRQGACRPAAVLAFGAGRGGKPLGTLRAALRVAWPHAAPPPSPPLQPDLLIGCLAVLPPGLTRLEVVGRATGPLPAALQRFTALRALTLAGDTADVDWGGRGSAAAAPALAPLLTNLRMSFTTPMKQEGNHGMDASCVPEPTCRFLGTCAALRSLDVEARWSPALGEVCRSLPALQQLRWVGEATGSQRCLPASLLLLRNVQFCPLFTLGPASSLVCTQLLGLGVMGPWCA